MPSSRAPTKDVPPDPVVPTKVRKSILVDPDEPRAARDARRRSRSKERPRLRSPPSDETISGRYVKHRSGKVDFIPDRAHDLEQKNSESNRQFRGKRDGYESEEGMQLRKERGGGGKPRPRRRAPVDSDDEEGRLLGGSRPHGAGGPHLPTMMTGALRPADGVTTTTRATRPRRLPVVRAGILTTMSCMPVVGGGRHHVAPPPQCPCARGAMPTKMTTTIPVHRRI